MLRDAGPSVHRDFSTLPSAPPPLLR